jgi:hypothetical protein
MNSTLKHKSFALAAGVALFCASIASAATERWIHVKVEGKNSENVAINLPLSFAASALAMVPAEAQVDGKIRIDNHDLDWNKLRDMWQQIKNAPEATFVTVQTNDEHVVVKKEGGFLLVQTTERSERGANVDVRLPMAVIDALLDAPEGTLNLTGALEALADMQDGHLVSIHSEDEIVKIWIDDQNGADPTR